MSNIKRNFFSSFCFLFTAPVMAVNINVNSNLDGTDVNPGDGLCADVTGSCTLRAAIQEANASAGADTVYLLSDTYVLTVGAANEDLAAEGDLDITDDLTIIGTGNISTIIDGNATDRIMDVNDARLELKDLTIQNGLLPGSYGDAGAGVRTLNDGALFVSGVRFFNNEAFSGGAVYCRGKGYLEITNSEFDTNHANSTDGSFGSGGAIRSLQSCGVSIANSSFSNNTAKGYGGAIQMQSGELLITTSTFTNNSVISPYNDDGGAISIYSGNQTTIVDSTFTGNEAYNAGAIMSRSPIYVYNSTFSNNTARSNIGGALMMTGAYLNGVVVDSNIGGGGSLSQTQVINSVFKNNTFDPLRQAIGGGISGSYLEIRDSAFINNSAYSSNSFSAGGGLYLSTQATIENTTISGNTSNNGGGIYLSASNGGNIYTLTNATITNNESINTTLAANLASYVTGITATLTNSIISAPIGGDNCVGAVATAGGNIASESTCSMGVQDSVTDPLLAALDTTDFVHPFLVNSPAIDTALPGPCPTTDQRSLFRSDNACDIGAYELGATPVTTKSVIAITESYTEMPELGSATFTITRSGSSEGEVSAVVTTMPESAWTYDDYTPLTQILTWAHGDTAPKIIEIAINEDQSVEDDEDFLLHLAAVSKNGTIDSLKQNGRVHIFDNDGNVGQISFDSTYTKWENKGTLTILVSRIYGSAKDYSVDYQSVDGTALSGADFTGVSGTLYWADGDAGDKVITIEMLDDNLVEGIEQFTLELFNHKRPGYSIFTDTSTVTIEDDESWAFFELSSNTYSVAENAGTLAVTVSRSGVLNETASIYLSANGSSGATASSFDDFSSYFQKLDFASGETTKTVNIQIKDDTLVEGDETFTLYISSPSSNGKLGEVTTAIATISDNETTPTNNTSSNTTTTASSGGGGGGSLSLLTLFLLMASRLLRRLSLPSLHLGEPGFISLIWSDR